jgi:hypothetical protein
MDPETTRASASQFAPLIMTLSALIGIGILFAHLVLPNHRYLRGLGYTFVLIAIALGTRLASPDTGWYFLPTIAVFVALVYAFYDAIQSTRERIRQYQEEVRERESAFAEYMKTLAKSDRASALLADTPPPRPTVPVDAPLRPPLDEE